MKSVNEALEKATKPFGSLWAAVESAPPEVETDLAAESRLAQQEASYRQRNLPERHRDCFLNSQHPEWAAAKGKVEAHLGSGCLMALVGIRGCGKTQIGVELLRSRQGWFCSAMDFFLDLQATFSKSSEKATKAILATYILHPFLVLDEAQERAETKWEDNLLTHLLNQRYNAKRDTLLISNLKPGDFQKSLGASIISRMTETGGIIECNWESFRRAA